jgi:Ca2+-binding EF-hand superfamily protein
MEYDLNLNCVENFGGEFAHSMDAYMSERESAWRSYVAAKEEESSGSLDLSLVRAGVARDFREQIWRAFAKQQDDHENNDEEEDDDDALRAEFNRMKADVERTKSKVADEQIELDLNRCFPGHVLFERDNVVKAKLATMLRVYARVDRAVGYAQGMHFVAATILVGVVGEHDGEFSESRAFALFAALMRVCRRYYGASMLGTKVSQRVLSQLIDELMSDSGVARALGFARQSDGGGTPLLPLITMSWLVSLLSTTLATELTLIVWDNVMSEQSDRPLFAAVLALLSMRASAVDEALAELGGDSASGAALSSIVALFREPLFDGLLEPRRFVDTFRAYLERIDETHLRALRRQAKQDVRQEGADVKLRRDVMQLSHRTNFSRLELEVLQVEFQSFLDERRQSASAAANDDDDDDEVCEDGIDIDAFERIIYRVMPRWRDLDVGAQALFDLFDRSGDGVVSFNELMTGLSILHGGTVQQKLKQVFRVYDADRSNSIDRDEFSRIFEQVFRIIYARPIAEQDREAWSMAFDVLDYNKDGTLSFDEFVDITRIMPGVLQFFEIEREPSPPLSPAVASSSSTPNHHRRRWHRSGKKNKAAGKQKGKTLNDVKLNFPHLRNAASLRALPLSDSQRQRIDSLSLVEQPPAAATASTSRSTSTSTGNEQTPLLARSSASNEPSDTCCTCSLQ